MFKSLFFLSAFTFILFEVFFFDAVPVEARIRKGKIEVIITYGSLKGRTFWGSFSFDDTDLKGKNIERMGVKSGGPARLESAGFKTFQFTFIDIKTGKSSRIYTEKDAPEFNEYDMLVFRNGILTNIRITVFDPKERTDDTNNIRPRNFLFRENFSFNAGKKKSFEVYGQGRYKLTLDP